jgi:aryl-alcohol dehydrogenase-like predicted oxidoreductase
MEARGYEWRSAYGYQSSTSDGDWRKTNPRFTGENFERNQRIVDEVEAVAAEASATPAQIALAWLLAQGDESRPPFTPLSHHSPSVGQCSLVLLEGLARF